MRSIVHHLSMQLFGQSLALPDFPVDKSLVGIGLSDWIEYASRLEQKLSYTNTYFHQEPRLDIAADNSDRASFYDFIISSDVFEHVVPPVSRAFKGTFNLLKPGGSFIFTVPFTNDETTIEHFPELNDFRVFEKDGVYLLENKTVDGRVVLHDNLVFHGGAGSTLEMRVFCRQDLIRHLEAAGFVDVQVHNEDVPEWGIIHQEQWSLPITARRPR